MIFFKRNLFTRMGIYRRFLWTNITEKYAGGYFYVLEQVLVVTLRVKLNRANICTPSSYFNCIFVHSPVFFSITYL